MSEKPKKQKRFSSIGRILLLVLFLGLCFGVYKYKDVLDGWLNGLLGDSGVREEQVGVYSFVTLEQLEDILESGEQAQELICSGEILVIDKDMTLTGVNLSSQYLTVADGVTLTVQDGNVMSHHLLVDGDIILSYGSISAAEELTVHGSVSVGESASVQFEPNVKIEGKDRIYFGDNAGGFCYFCWSSSDLTTVLKKIPEDLDGDPAMVYLVEERDYDLTDDIPEGVGLMTLSSDVALHIPEGSTVQLNGSLDLSGGNTLTVEGDLVVGGEMYLFWNQKEVHPLLRISESGTVQGTVHFYTVYGGAAEMVEGYVLDETRLSLEGDQYSYTFS